MNQRGNFYMYKWIDVYITVLLPYDYTITISRRPEEMRGFVFSAKIRNCVPARQSHGLWTRLRQKILLTQHSICESISSFGKH